VQGMDNIDIIAQLGDLKEIDYRNTLAIASLIELLVEKGFLNRIELARKACQLDRMSVDEIALMRKRSSV
jgi:hypothetical protein